MIHCANHEELAYRGGQGPIIHLMGDFFAAVAWAQAQSLRWAFTLSNAGTTYFEDRCDVGQLHEINWAAVAARTWSGQGVSPQIKEGKQAEFLVERCFPWELIECIGVASQGVAQRVANIIAGAAHRPRIEVRSDWYY